MFAIKNYFRYIIHNLDDNGYLSIAYEDYDEIEIDRGIQLLQQVGPIGIGARNLQECLADYKLHTIFQKKN